MRGRTSDPDSIVEVHSVLLTTVSHTTANIATEIANKNDTIIQFLTDMSPEAPVLLERPPGYSVRQKSAGSLHAPAP